VEPGPVGVVVELVLAVEDLEFQNPKALP